MRMIEVLVGDMLMSFGVQVSFERRIEGLYGGCELLRGSFADYIPFQSSFSRTSFSTDSPRMTVILMSMS